MSLTNLRMLSTILSLARVLEEKHLLFLSLHIAETQAPRLILDKVCLRSSPFPFYGNIINVPSLWLGSISFIQKLKDSSPYKVAKFKSEEKMVHTFFIIVAKGQEASFVPNQIFCIKSLSHGQPRYYWVSRDVHHVSNQIVPFNPRLLCFCCFLSRINWEKPIRARTPYYFVLNIWGVHGRVLFDFYKISRVSHRPLPLIIFIISHTFALVSRPNSSTMRLPYLSMSEPVGCQLSYQREVLHPLPITTLILPLKSSLSFISFFQNQGHSPIALFSHNDLIFNLFLLIQLT